MQYDIGQGNQHSDSTSNKANNISDVNDNKYSSFPPVEFFPFSGKHGQEQNEGACCKNSKR